MTTQSVDIEFAKQNLDMMISLVEKEEANYIITVDSIPKAILANIDGTVQITDNKNMFRSIDKLQSFGVKD